MPFKVFSDLETLYASEVNDYLMEQVVIACTSGTRPSSPNEGMTIYETDTDALQVYNGSSWMQIGPLVAYTSWAATVTQSGSVTITSQTSGYMRVGRMIQAYTTIDPGGSGTGGNIIQISPPVAFRAGVQPFAGVFWVLDDSGPTHYVGGTFPFAGVNIIGIVHGQSSAIGATPSFALDAADQLGMNLVYEAAS